MQTKGDGRQGTDVITLLLYLLSPSLAITNGRYVDKLRRHSIWVLESVLPDLTDRQPMAFHPKLVTKSVAEDPRGCSIENRSAARTRAKKAIGGS